MRNPFKRQRVLAQLACGPVNALLVDNHGSVEVHIPQLIVQLPQTQGTLKPLAEMTAGELNGLRETLRRSLQQIVLNMGHSLK